MSKHSGSVKTCEQLHTKEPTGYIEWNEFAANMSKTHRQVMCPNCGLYKIWVPKDQEPPHD